MNQSQPEWEKEFADECFCKEDTLCSPATFSCKYDKNRIIEYIRSLLLKTRTAEQERVVGIVEGKFDEPHEGTDDVTKEQSDYWVDGYNQALTDITEAIRGKENGV